MEQRLYYSLTKTQHRLHQYVKQILKKRSIQASPAQLGILFLLKEKNNSSMTYISNELELDNAAITRSIDKLETMGLVKRVVNSKDRREFSIELTKAGLSEIEKSVVVIKEINQLIESKFPKEKFTIFKEVLHQLNAILNEELEKYN